MEAQEVEDLIKRAADDRRREVPDVERLSNVDGGVIEHDVAPGALVRGAIPFLLGRHFAKRRADKLRPGQEEVEVAAREFRTVDPWGQFPERIQELLRDGRRRFAQFPRQLEAGERKIAHVHIRRHFQKGRELVRIQPGGLREQQGELFFIIHAFTAYSPRNGGSLQKIS